MASTSVARTHFFVLFGKVTVLLPLFRFGIQQIIKLNSFISTIPCPGTNLAVRVAFAVFGIAGEMRQLPAYF